MNRVLSVCKRYRRPLGIAFLALLCLGILACIWLTAVLPAQSKSQSVKLNDQYVPERCIWNCTTTIPANC